MLSGRHCDEATLYRAGFAFEQSGGSRRCDDLLLHGGLARGMLSDAHHAARREALQ
jgi:hypothetical protein